MSNPVRVGVIGCGGIGNIHMDKLQAVGAKLVAVCDIDPAPLRAAAKQYTVANAFTDYRELLALDEVDAVTVGLPNYLHAEVTIAAAKAGKHVFCEKPMAMNVAECKAMIAAAARAKRVLQIGLVNRFYAESQLTRSLVAAGKLGQVYHALAAATRRRGVPGRGGWFTTKAKSGGGPLIDIGVHILDLTTWLMGRPRPVAVSAQTYQKFIHRDDYAYTGMWGKPVAGGPTNVEDYVTALIRFAGGSTCRLECSWAANIHEGTWSCQLLGDKAGAFVDPGSRLVVSGQDDRLLTDTTPIYRKLDPWQEQFKAFLASCRTGRRPVVPGEHGQYTQALLDAIYRSAAAGREIRIRPSDLPKTK
ncbi:MAG: Gfo/Idh/MocA family oxidoreductase [Phycisphaerae bacterium]|nr:Gfo/Idh/MocA family oxidoreductase [Phycisphaerae bacterium]